MTPRGSGRLSLTLCTPFVLERRPPSRGAWLGAQAAPQVPPQALALSPRWPLLLPPPLSPLPATLQAGAFQVGPASRNAFPEGASPLAARSPPAPASGVPSDAGLGPLRPEAAVLLAQAEARPAGVTKPHCI